MQYQTQPILASYIASIRHNSREVDVDHLWTNLLAYYFPTVEDYGIEREAYIVPRSQARANVCLRTLIDNSITTVIMVENKKPTTAQSSNPPTSSWVNAKAQLEGYLLSRRANEQSHLNLFGIVGIGGCVKFFQLRRGRSELEDYRHDSFLKLDQDSSEIERIIEMIKRYIARHR